MADGWTTDTLDFLSSAVSAILKSPASMRLAFDKLDSIFVDNASKNVILSLSSFGAYTYVIICLFVCDK